jgi:hypothetical protein
MLRRVIGVVFVVMSMSPSGVLVAIRPAPVLGKLGKLGKWDEGGAGA